MELLLSITTPLTMFLLAIDCIIWARAISNLAKTQQDVYYHLCQLTEAMNRLNKEIHEIKLHIIKTEKDK